MRALSSSSMISISSSSLSSLSLSSQSAIPLLSSTLSHSFASSAHGGKKNTETNDKESSSSSASPTSSPANLYLFLRKKFRERFVIGDDFPPYIPQTAKEKRENYSHPLNPQEISSVPTVYRGVAPSNQPEANYPYATPETTFDTQMWKRDKIKSLSRAPPGVSEFEWKYHHNMEVGDPEGIPMHLPRTWWMRNTTALATWRLTYIRGNGGAMMAGPAMPLHRIKKDYYEVVPEEKLIL